MWRSFLAPPAGAFVGMSKPGGRSRHSGSRAPVLTGQAEELIGARQSVPGPAEAAMKYLILIYLNPRSRAIWEGFTDDQRAAGLQVYAALNEELAASGELIISRAAGRSIPDPMGSAAGRRFADGRAVCGGEGVDRRVLPGAVRQRRTGAGDRRADPGDTRRVRRGATRDGPSWHGDVTSGPGCRLRTACAHGDRHRAEPA